MIGRLRVNSTLPLASLSVPHPVAIFDGVGTDATETLSLTLEAIGDVPVTVAELALDGQNATEFSLDDRCSGATLQPGAVCAFDVSFAPSVTGRRDAILRVSHDAPVSPHEVGLLGSALIPTHTVIHVEPVEPKTVMLTPAVSVVGTVSPNPAGGSADVWIDGQVTAVGVGVDGRIPLTRPRVPGTYTARVHFLESPTHAASWSPDLEFTVSNTTVTKLDALSPSIAQGSSVLLAATVETASNLLYDGGVVTFWDTSNGTVLGSGLVTRAQPTISLYVELPVGAHTIQATYSGVDGILDPSSSGSQPVTVLPDTTPPSGSVAIADGGLHTSAQGVSLAVPASDAGSGVSTVALSNDGTTWTERAYGPTQSWTLAPGDGTRTVWVKWRDGVGNWSAPVHDTIVLDTRAPTVGAPGRRLVAGTTVDGGRVVVRLPWTGSDATSGIARYELAQQTDGEAWVTVAGALPTPSAERSLATGHAYRFRVRAIDLAGNASAWLSGSTFSLGRVQETSTRIRYGGTWTTAKATTYWAGAARRASVAGARATISFTGRSIAWVSRTGPDRGKAAIYVNGSRVATVDLYAPTAGLRRVVWVGTFATSASRTISIRVLGTAGRPRVDLDAVVTAS
jgi:Bacterial Ig-like domain (group 3)